MNEYNICFIIYGKKMQCNIFASSEYEAEQRLREKIEIAKIEKLPKYNFTEEINKLFGKL